MSFLFFKNYQIQGNEQYDDIPDRLIRTLYLEFLFTCHRNIQEKSDSIYILSSFRHLKSEGLFLGVYGIFFTVKSNHHLFL